jgi:hypothetical protein
MSAIGEKPMSARSAINHQVVPATDDKIAQAIPCNPCKLFKEGPLPEQSLFRGACKQ